MDKAFTVSLCNPDKEVYVALDLPAEPTPYWMCGSGFGPPRVPKWNGR